MNYESFSIKSEIQTLLMKKKIRILKNSRTYLYARTFMHNIQIPFSLVCTIRKYITQLLIQVTDFTGNVQR